MTCKDCIFYEVCFDFRRNICEVDKNRFEEYRVNSDGLCSNFKDKSRFVKLPCKVGQTVYVPWCWECQQGVAIVRVEEIKFYDSQMHYMLLLEMESDDESFNQSFGGWKLDESIGKTIFLTREEAEKALAEREGKK